MAEESAGIDLPVQDLVSLLRMRAQLHPERRAIDFLGDGDHVTDSVTYAQLDERVRTLAAALQLHGAPGERALLLFPSGLDYVVAFFACLHAGLIAVPAYPPEAGQPQAFKRLAGMADDAQPVMALTDAAGLQAIARQSLNRPGMRVIDVATCNALPGAWRERVPDPGDIAFLQYTSGSTAAPKGVMVSHRHLVADKRSISATAGERADDRYFSWLPLFHDLGLILGLLQPVFYGLPLVLMSPKHFLERPRRWLEAVSTHRATISGGPDFAYRLCAERLRPEAMAGVDLSCWRVAFSGAEPIRHATMQAFARTAAPFGFDPKALNAWYGLAEATLVVSGRPRGSGLHWQRFDADALARGEARAAEEGTPLPACGSTAADVVAAIVQPDTGDELPPGRVGEIWVRGPTVAGGYWHNDAATRQTFGAFTSQGDGPFLRTGDLGFMHDGALYISSRLKDLIILRGRNVYPQDIEAEVEARVRGVRPGRVAAFAIDADDGEAIGIAAEAARLRPGEGDASDVVEAICAAVAEALGEPVAAVALLKPGSLPKTSSGKLQRAACRQGWIDGTLEMVCSHRAGARPADAEAVEPTPTMQRLARLWGDLLDVPAIGPHDSFFALGGQSLLMTRLALRIESEFGVAALPLAALFSAPTLSAQARLIDAAARIEPGCGRQPLVARPSVRHALLPLSHAQRRLWFLQSLEPQGNVYNVAARLSFSGPVDQRRLEHALSVVVQRHEALRTVFIDTDDGPRQQVVPAAPVVFAVSEVSDGAAMLARATDFVAQPFDLASGPLLRSLWMQGAADGAPQLVIALHHIAVDGASLAVLLADLAAAYAGETLPPPPLQIADHALWQQAVMPGRLPALAATAVARLADAPRLSTLPADAARPPQQSHRGDSMQIHLPAAFVARVQAWAEARHATLFMALFAAHAATLAEQSGQHDLVIGTDIAHRGEPGTEGIVGFFVNQLPVRCRWQPGEGGSAWLARVRRNLLDAYELQDLPFDKLVEALRPARDLAHAPVFQTKFVFQEAPAPHALAPGVSMHAHPLARHAAELDLLFDLARHADGVTLRAEYATDLYRRDTVERFVALFVARLESWLIEQPQAESIAPAGPARSIARRAARAATPLTENLQ